MVQEVVARRAMEWWIARWQAAQQGQGEMRRAEADFCHGLVPVDWVAAL
jgi:hypothetical protein